MESCHNCLSRGPSLYVYVYMYIFVCHTALHLTVYSLLTRTLDIGQCSSMLLVSAHSSLNFIVLSVDVIKV